MRILLTFLMTTILTFAAFADTEAVTNEQKDFPILNSYGKDFADIKAKYAQNYGRGTYEEVTSLWRELSLLAPKDIEINNLQRWEEKRHKLVIEISKYRYQIIDSDKLSLDADSFLSDSLFEFQMIPTRWVRLFQIKYAAFKTKLNQALGSNDSLRGLQELLPELLTTILFVFLPFIVIWLNSWLVKRVNDARDEYSNPYKFTPVRQKVALVLQKLGPFIPLALSIFALKLFSRSIQRTIFAELSLLIPFITYYLYYRIFRQLVINLLMIFSEYVKLGKSRDAKLKIFKSTKVTGLFFLWSLYLLHLVSSVAGKGLLYQEMYFIFKGVGVLLYLWLVKTWTPEIDTYSQKILTEKLKEYYIKLSKVALISFVLRTFAFLLILIQPIYTEFKDRLLELGVGKTIVAKFFQRKLEGSEKLQQHADAELPEDYLHWFRGEKDDDEKVWVLSKGQRLKEIKAEIDEWLEDKSEEHSLAIYGDKGIGKTQVLRHLEKELMNHPKKPEIINAIIPPKMTSKKDILKFLGQLVAGREMTEVFELLEIDKELEVNGEKKIIILDEAHNLFLTHFGGLKGITTFFETLNVRTENIFWVASFNTFSWVYLDQVFHRNKYFRTVFKIRGFSDEEIQEYILKRHENSGFSLSYADIIRAVNTKNYNTGSNEISYVENMFFRILWEQSNGNPELAEKLWLRALKPLWGNRLKVGLPLVESFSVLNQLNDDAFFVFSALIRHENLSTNEIIKVTDMKEGVVRHNLRIGLENGFLQRNDSDKRYRFSIDGQYPILATLKAKNFIYE